MSSSMLDDDQIPVEVQVDESMIRVRFSGGLEVATPVARFPWLKNANPAQLARWELVGGGCGIHWPDEILLCLKMITDGFIEIYNGPFPVELLEGKTSSNGQVPLSVKKLLSLNPRCSPIVGSFDFINRWFKSTPELAEVA
jgi:hypothetical protein